MKYFDMVEKTTKLLGGLDPKTTKLVFGKKQKFWGLKTHHESGVNLDITSLCTISVQGKYKEELCSFLVLYGYKEDKEGSKFFYSTLIAKDNSEGNLRMVEFALPEKFQGKVEKYIKGKGIGW